MRLGPMSGEVAALAVLTATLQLAAPTAAVENGAGSGVTMQLWDNSAMAGTPTSVTSSAPLSHAWDAVGPQSALWTGSLLPPSTTTYNFSCTFLNGYGLAWVDGHLMCHDGMPLYAHLIGAGPLRLAANTPVPIRLQFVRNDTTKAQASAALLWAINPSPDSPQFSGQPKHDGAPQNGLGPIPSSALQMAPASKAEAAMEALQMEQYTETAGWGSWCVFFFHSFSLFLPSWHLASDCGVVGADSACPVALRRQHCGFLVFAAKCLPVVRVARCPCGPLFLSSVISFVSLPPADSCR